MDPGSAIENFKLVFGYLSFHCTITLLFLVIDLFLVREKGVCFSFVDQFRGVIITLDCRINLISMETRFHCVCLILCFEVFNSVKAFRT